jgi:hypothetical protein
MELFVGCESERHIALNGTILPMSWRGKARTRKGARFEQSQAVSLERPIDMQRTSNQPLTSRR